MTNYQTGHIKYEPETRQVAIRSIHDNSSMRWVVATSSAGARSATDDEIAAWADLYTPPANND